MLSIKPGLVFGQMNELPAVRLRIALTGLTVANSYADVERQDVLLFIDNIYRYTLAGMEVSALLGRMPLAVGYATLATEMGPAPERHRLYRQGLYHLLPGYLRARRQLCRSPA